MTPEPSGTSSTVSTQETPLASRLLMTASLWMTGPSITKGRPLSAISSASSGSQVQPRLTWAGKMVPSAPG